MNKIKYTHIYLLLLGLVLGCSEDPIVEMPEEEEFVVPDPGKKYPLLIIETGGVEIPDDPKIPADLNVVWEGKDDFQGKIAIETRGSTSQWFPKKPYAVELKGEDGKDTDFPLCGLPEEEDWVLHNPYSDKSLLRNFITYEIAREIQPYASRTQICEVELNGEYQGVYILQERIKRDVHRVDINKLKEDENQGEDVTGGYIIKIDKATGETDNAYTAENSFKSHYNIMKDSIGNEIVAGKASDEVFFLYHYPKVDDITPEQKDYIASYVKECEDALLRDDFTDPSVGYRKYMDEDSFIDYMIITELSKNIDGYRLSTYLYKDKNGELTAGPAWDYNLGYGNAKVRGVPQDWVFDFNEREPGDYWLVPFWWKRFLEDPYFTEKLKSRWAELRGSVISDNAILNIIDTQVEEMSDAGLIDRNFEKWPILMEEVWPNAFVGGTYEAEIMWMKDWLMTRTSWIDQAILEL